MVARQIDGWLDLDEPGVDIVLKADGRLVERRWYGDDGWCYHERTMQSLPIAMPHCEICGIRTWDLALSRKRARHWWNKAPDARYVCNRHQTQDLNLDHARPENRWTWGYTDPDVD